MIENMRKYTGLMVVVLILLAAGLILTMGDFRPNTGTRAKVTEVYGTPIDQQEYRKLGRNSVGIIKELKDFELSNYAIDLIYNQNLGPRAAFGFAFTGTSDNDINNFVNRRVVIAKTAADYGIYPSPALAEKHIIDNMFAKDGAFDGAAYQDFIKRIGSTGMQEQDFVNLVAESLVHKKLKNLISNGLQSPNALTNRAVMFGQQTLDLTTIDISIDPYKAKIQPTEEEIHSYWQENNFNYLTDRKIRVTYIVEKPVYASPRPTQPVRTPDTTEEDFKKMDEEYQKALTQWELDVQKKADNLVAAKIDDLAYVIDESEGARFTEEIEAAGIKFYETDLFSANDAPAELQKLVGNRGEKIPEVLFNQKISDSLQYRIPAPIKLEGNGWFYVRFDEEVLPTTKEYEAAKELAKADLIQEKATEAMLADVDTIKQKLAESIKNGVTAEEAAQINNLKATKRANLTFQSLAKTPEGRPLDSELEIFKNGAITEMNSFSENNVIESDKVVLVFLEKRQVVDSVETVDNRLSIIKSRSEMLQDSVYRAWIDDAVAKANIPDISRN